MRLLWWAAPADVARLVPDLHEVWLSLLPRMPQGSSGGALLPGGEQMTAPTLVSLFSGAGGLDLGLEMAGFDTVSVTDMDADCIKTLQASQEARIPIPGWDGRTFFERANILRARVEELRPEDLRRSGDRRRVPDLMAGGPPCQPFSSSGKLLSVVDPRGRLFEDFVRLAEGLRPRVILFENVRGLVTAPGPTGVPGEALSLVKGSFEDIGYATRFALLNAADFGAPQRRVRMFMLASRSCGLPGFPESTHSDGPVSSLFGSLASWVTLGEFLATQPPPEPAEVVQPSAELARSLASVREGSGLKSPGAREATRPGGHWGYKQGTFVADLSRPARTVTAATTQDWIREHHGRLRRLTWRECAGLQGFPDGWRFSGNLASKYRQIGNAVPSVFGLVLGRAVLAALSTSGRSRPTSAPLPPSFREAIAYTQRERSRNGESRRRAAELLAAGADLRTVKGLGSAEPPSRDPRTEAP